jgi:hypothetical protein
LLAYTKAFSKNIGHHFTSDTIRISAITGSAAIAIEGDTTCRHFGLAKAKVDISDIEKCADTRMNIVDEISFATKELLVKLSEKTQAQSECHDNVYGSIPMVFLGDFCQLEGIGGVPIFAGAPSIYWELCLNQLVELDGTHRYSSDPELGVAMAQARNGDSTMIRSMLKSRVIHSNNLTLPQNLEARYAVYTNKKRSEVNANVVRQYLQQFHPTEDNVAIPKGAIIIRGQARWSTTKKQLGKVAHHMLWQHCSDGHVTDRAYKADPFLVLFYGCEMMVNDNIDVKGGIANGTCCVFEKAVLNHNAQIQKMKVHRRWVNTVDIAELDHIVLRFAEMHKPAFVGTFKLFPREKKLNAEFPNTTIGSSGRVNVKIDMLHLPVVLNYATTVHKLQGKSMDNLVIVEWNNKRNWAYVVLSRVRSLAGIFLCKALPEDYSFEPDPQYVSMMERLRNRILAKPLSAQ